MEKWGIGTLEDLIKNKKVNINNINIKTKLEKLINKMYNIKINHLDLHAGNILYNIDKTGNITFKIIDFGLAKVNNVKQCNRTFKLI